EREYPQLALVAPPPDRLLISRAVINNPPSPATSTVTIATAASSHAATESARALRRMATMPVKMLPSAKAMAHGPIWTLTGVLIPKSRQTCAQRGHTQSQKSKVTPAVTQDTKIAARAEVLLTL